MRLIVVVKTVLCAGRSQVGRLLDMALCTRDCSQALLNVVGMFRQQSRFGCRKPKAIKAECGHGKPIGVGAAAARRLNGSDLQQSGHGKSTGGGPAPAQIRFTIARTRETDWNRSRGGPAPIWIRFTIERTWETGSHRSRGDTRKVKYYCF